MDRSLHTHAECAYIIITYLIILSQVISKKLIFQAILQNIQIEKRIIKYGNMDL